MDNNLTTRTYAAPTCTLMVSSKEQHRAVDRTPIDFILHLEPLDGAELDRITLSGQPDQLNYLHQIVSQYITELVAKFPLPNTTDRQQPAAAPAPIADAQTGLNSQTDDPQPDDNLAARLGILKNLPGLRNSLTKSSEGARENFAAKPSISRLLGDRQPENRHQLDPDAIEPTSPATAAPTAPYLTGTGNRSLDHQLHLGTLTNHTAGEVVTLSAIQLFDLATVLDEYVAEHITTTSSDRVVATPSRANIPANGNRAAAPGATATARSPLPNLPNFTAEADPSQIYYRQRRSQSSWLSALPWAVAATLAVGVPLLILDPNPNPLKDAVSKLNLFEPPTKIKKSTVVTTTKSNPATLPGTATTTDPSTIATAPTVGTPAPWQAQPVPPPQVPQPVPPSLTTPSSSTQLGTAPLPEAIATAPGVVPPTIASTGGTAIAPNPLNSTQPSSLPTKIDNTISRTTPTTAAAKPGTTGIGALTSSRAPNKALILPGDVTASTASTKPIAPGKLSVSKRPMLIPAPNLSPIVNPSISAPIPFNPPAMELPSTPKNAAQPKVKPTPVAATTKPVKAAETDANPSPSEPIVPVSQNPNLITPSPSNPEQIESQTPPIVPDRPLQSSANTDGADAALQETKRYFQGKWKANAAQTNSLQYVLQVSGKSGIVRTISPQGEAATTYLQQTKFIKPGQKLVSPAAAGTSDQRIRVLLQPDGNVDTFTEP
ncbi:DUF4335 domain-containing protein [Chamaesiphon sp.]|uniref:DUF4335 domain-containing protein n=1 Tax=Chamaesiphon sp. TaxID=2814140 RepID=UPI0035936F4E